MDSKYYAVLMAIIAVALTGYTFISSEADADGTHTLTSEVDHGEIIDTSTGKQFVSASVDEISLRYEPIRGYEFLEWVISGDCTTVSNGCEITISDLKEDVHLGVKTRYYSTSQELINIIDVDGLPVPGDSLVNTWSIKSDNLDMTGAMWKGMPCTPLIVDETVYVRAGGMLYALDINTGTILNSVRSQGIEIDFYHYLSYGNGVIFDTVGGAAYDLELNKLYDLPSSLKFVTYHDGCFFGCSSVIEGKVEYYTMFKTTLDKDSYIVDGVKQNMFHSSEKYRLFAQYGQFGNVLIVGGWFFFLQADGIVGNGGYRAISAFNINTEECVTCELTGIAGMPWDDGWLTYYGGYFYITAYTAGLFDGVIPGLEDKRSTIGWVKFDFDNGNFENPRFEEIKTPGGSTFKGIASGLVIYNGRGYVNVRALGTDTLGGSDDSGTCMIAYDISEDGTPTPAATAPSYMTHGGIVVNVAHEKEGLFYIYMVPYNSMDQGVYVFTDEYKDGVWNFKSSYDKISPTRYDWCSQCIRAGPNGELVYYVDSGYLDCYTKVRSFDITVILDSGETAEVNAASGSSLMNAISSLYKGASFDGSNVKIGEKTYEAYGLNVPSSYVYAWEQLTDLSASKFIGRDMSAVIEGKYRYVILLESGAPDKFTNWDDANKWYYFDGNDYVKCVLADSASINAAVGKSIIFANTKPVVDPTDIWPTHPISISVNREGSVDISLPEGMNTFSYEISIPSSLIVSKEGQTLTVKGQLEKNVVLSLIINGKEYPIQVTVLPKVTVDGDKTIIESETESQSPGGNTVSVNSIKVEEPNKSTFTSIEETRNVSGGVIETRYTKIVIDDMGDIVDGIPVKVENKEYYLLNDSGERMEWRISEKRTIVVDNLGSVETSIFEVVEDKVSGEKKTTDSSEVVYASSIVKIVKINTEDKNGNMTGSRTVEVNTKTVGVPVSIPSSVIEKLGDVEEFPINLETARIVLSGSVVSNFVGKGDLYFSVSQPLKTSLSSKVRSAVGDAKVFSIELKCGDEQQHDFGRFTVALACDIEIQEGKELKVWRIDDYGKKTYAENVAYSDGRVTFDADHLSIYAVGYASDDGSGGPSETEGGSGGTVLLAGTGAIAVLALLGAVFLLRRRR